MSETCTPPSTPARRAPASIAWPGASAMAQRAGAARHRSCTIERRPSSSPSSAAAAAARARCCAWWPAWSRPAQARCRSTAQAIDGLHDDTRIMFQEARLLPWRASRQRHARAAARAAARGRGGAGAGRPGRARAANGRRGCRAASASAWRWRARWCTARGCCCSTSRWARSMR